MVDTFVTVPTVRFLEAAGARIVPINYRLRKTDLIKVLSSVNGVYIHGDD
jgi:hypothetical protein